MKKCSDCSFFIVEDDIQNLTAEDQIKFERIKIGSISDNEQIDLIELRRLLAGIRKKTCIGGLIKNNEIRDDCIYHNSDLPKDFDNSQLLNLFISQKTSKFSQKSWITTIILAVITVSVTLFGIILSSKNRELTRVIEKSQVREINLNKSILTLLANQKRDSILIKNLRDSASNHKTTYKNK